MAQLNPLFLDTGSIRRTTSSLNAVIDYIHFPVSQSGSSGIFTTLLPEPFLFASQSVRVSNAVSTTSSSLYQYNIPARAEKYLYSTDAIIGVSSSVTTTGVRIGLQLSQNNNTAFNIKSPSTLTAFTFACVGTEDATVFVLPAGHAAINTVYPTHVKGLTTNALTSPTSSISNTFLVQPETNNVVSATTGSVFYNQFAGFSSSFSITSSSPLYLSGSLNSLKAISDSHTITSSFLPPTSSLWISQSLTVPVSNSSATVYATVFDTAGLTTGQRYLANLYIAASSSAITTGFRMRAITGSQYMGSIIIPTSTTAISIRNSANGADITNAAPTAAPAGNFLAYGEYTFVKGATNPQVQILSEIAGSFVFALTGSVIYYRPIS